MKTTKTGQTTQATREWFEMYSPSKNPPRNSNWK